MKSYTVFYYDLTGANGVAQYDASNEIVARDQFLAQHPTCNVNYIVCKNSDTTILDQ